MAVLERRVKINPNGSQYGQLNSTQEAVFNEFLESIVDFKIDSRYNDDQHMLLSGINGDEYYFDSYKYIYPVKCNELSNVSVINNNVGYGEISLASLYEGDKFVVEHYVGETSMERIVYNLPMEYLNNMSSISQFLLNASSLHPAVVGNLEKISAIKVVKYGDTIQCINENGEVVSEQFATNSFYNDSINVVGNAINTSSRSM